MNTVEPRHRELAEAIIGEWNRYQRQQGKLYKLIPTDPHDGRIRRVVATAMRSAIKAMVIESHNMSKTVVNSKRGTHTLTLWIDYEEGLTRVELKPTKPAELEPYLKCWPELRAILPL